MLWESVWAEGDGAAIDESTLTARDKDDLVTLYPDKDFIPSLTALGTVALLGEHEDDFKFMGWFVRSLA